MNNSSSLRPVLAALALTTLACGGANADRHAEQPCRRGPGDEVERAASTAVEGVKTGAKTGVEGVKAAGSAVGGFVEGGSAEASERWQTGKEQTRATAREGARKTSDAAHEGGCD